MLRFAIFLAIGLLTGCASQYEKTKVGGLSGRLIVEWLEPDSFLFLPDDKRPLTFTRSTGEAITPGKMFTDGGSIPRPLWALKNYSPWGYGPAFIVHDWLFEMKHCALPGAEKYNVEEAAVVMVEVMKTLMLKDPKFEPDPPTLDLMYTAVSSSVAAKLWENGTCDRPAAEVLASPDGKGQRKPIRRFVIEY